MSMVDKDLAALFTELRKVRAQEEVTFSKKVDEAVKEVRHRGNWTLAVVAAAVVFVWNYAQPIVRHFVSEKMVYESVREELHGFASNKVASVVEASLSDVEARIRELSLQLDERKRTLDVLTTRSLAENGDESEMIKLRSLAQKDPFAAKQYENAKRYFSGQMTIRGDNYCMRQVNWKAQDPKLTREEMLARLEKEDAFGWDEVNYIRNLAMKREDRPEISVFVGYAIKAKDLNVRMAIVDCIHAIDSTCPRVVLKDEIEEWWKCKKRNANNGN